jgi:hypothetical protein
MPCQLNNHSNTDLSSLEPHVQGMYDYFDQKLGFNKPPTMHFDSDPSNQSNVLGKTAYYDPSSLEIHIFTDGRHPKDMLRSIAHELIHHQQNLEGRLNVGGYMGQGYYLKNEAMRELEQEAMLQGNGLMREYEDTLKIEEKNEMSLKEWKNNELNKLMLEKFGILKEELENPKKADLDKDGKLSGYEKKRGAAIEKSMSQQDEEMNEEVVEEEDKGDKEELYRYDKDGKIVPVSKAYKMGQKVGKFLRGEKNESLEEEKDDDPRGRAQTGDSPTKKRTGKPDPSGKRFADQGKGKPYLRKEGLQETLKRIAKAKNITLRSSGKKIK